MPPPYCYDYPRPALTVDLTVFCLTDQGLRALFIKRNQPPFVGQWAIPGGFVEIDEPVEAAARRELKEETTLTAPSFIAEIGTFAAPGRDPRGRTISIAHAAVIRPPLPSVQGSDDAREAAWLDPRHVKKLAFDHDKIIERGLEWLKTAVVEGPAGVAMLPKNFTKDHVLLMFHELFGAARGATAWWRAHGKIQETRSSKKRR